MADDDVDAPERTDGSTDPDRPAWIGPVGVGLLLAIALLMFRSPAAAIRIGKLAAAMAVCVVVHLMTFYLLALAAGVAVQVVSIGFGGALLRFRRGRTWFALNWLPIGGFVKMKGMEEHADAPDGWRRLSRLSRAAFCLAGPWAVLALGLCVLGFAKFKAALMGLPAQTIDVLRKNGPGVGNMLRFLDHAAFPDVLGAVAVVFGIINLLPLLTMNGGQAIAQLLDVDPRSAWHQGMLVGSVLVLLTIALLVLGNVVTSLAR